jgi:hypothetical protein
MDLISIVNVGCEAEAEFERMSIACLEDGEPEFGLLDRLADQSTEAVRAATRCPALTDAELIAKARLLATVTLENQPDDPVYQLAQSLLRDLQLQQANVVA